MPEEYVLKDTPQVPVEETESSHFPRWVIYAAVGLGILIIFIIGIIIGKSGSSKKITPVAVVTSTPTPAFTDLSSLTPTPVSEVPLMQFLPNKQYFDDTYIVIAKDPPHAAIILSVARIEQLQNFVEYTKVNYFNGQTWDRKVVITTISSPTVTKNSLLRSWVDPSQIQQQSYNQTQLASLQLPGKIVSFSSADILNEISIQSLPGSSKFIYQGLGTMTTGTDTDPAYVFHSRTYSFNAVDLAYLGKPDNLTSNSLIFWDKENTFYYVDSHSVPQSTNPIQNFQVGIQETSTHNATRTPNVYISLNTSDKGKEYVANFSAPLNETITLPENNSINKADKRSYVWITDIGEGKVVKPEGRTVQGIGISEYIKAAK